MLIAALVFPRCTLKHLCAVGRDPRWFDSTGTMRPELSILSFLCAVLLVGLAPLHVQARNIAILALIAWLLVCSIIQGVDSIVWSSDIVVRSPGWCDISEWLSTSTGKDRVF